MTPGELYFNILLNAGVPEYIVTIIKMLEENSLEKQMEIIVLERTKELGNALSLLLLTFGLHGITVCNKADAFQALQTHPNIKCGIVDIDNKSTEGVPFIREIRQKEQFKDMIIIVHTIRKIKLLQSALVPLGVIASIMKPFEETRTLHQLKKILPSICFTGTEKRQHIRVKPDPNELARVHFMLKFYPRLIYGKILDVSMGGIAVNILKTPPQAFIKKGIRIPQLIFSLDYKQIKASGIVQLQRGKVIVIHFNPLSRKAATLIARYIFKRISAD